MRVMLWTVVAAFGCSGKSSVDTGGIESDTVPTGDADADSDADADADADTPPHLRRPAEFAGVPTYDGMMHVVDW